MSFDMDIDPYVDLDLDLDIKLSVFKRVNGDKSRDTTTDTQKQ